MSRSEFQSLLDKYLREKYPDIDLGIIHLIHKKLDDRKPTYNRIKDILKKEGWMYYYDRIYTIIEMIENEFNLDKESKERPDELSIIENEVNNVFSKIIFKERKMIINRSDIN